MMGRFHNGIANAIAHAAEDHGHPEVSANIAKAINLGKLAQLIPILAPVVIALISGQPVDWAKLAAEIAALFSTP